MGVLGLEPRTSDAIKIYDFVIASRILNTVTKSKILTVSGLVIISDALPAASFATKSGSQAGGPA